MECTRAAMVAALCLATLSGCAAGTAQVFEYTGKDVVQYQLSLPDTDLETLIIRMHPKDPRRAWVLPTAGDSFGQGFFKGTSQWIVRVDDFREIYSKALTDHLLMRQLSCSISQADPFPEYFAFEFRFTCKGD